MISEKLAEAAGAENVRTQAMVTRIRHERGRLVDIEVNRATRMEVQEVVSTLPINRLLELLDPPPPADVLKQARRLKFRNLILVVLFLHRPSVTPNASVYFPEAHVPFTRVSEPRNRSPRLSPAGQTCLVAELCCHGEDELWRSSDEALCRKVIPTLEQMGWVKPGSLIGTEVRRMGFAYPVLELGYETTFGVLNEYLAGFANLNLAGRNSLFAYTHLHDQMKAGRELIDRYGKDHAEPS
jgi:protoporphyrinogen oxidase